MALHLLKPVLGNNGRSFCTSTLKMTINNVTVIGGGTMGAGIAQVKKQSPITPMYLHNNETIIICQKTKPLGRRSIR